MPELPEVETTKNYLIPHVLKTKIIGVKLPSSRLIKKEKKVSLKSFKENLLHNQITQITRRGKYLLFHFHQKISLIIHLGMSGKIIVKKRNNFLLSKKIANPITKKEVFHPTEAQMKHLYFYLKFNHQKELFFYDPRTFGKIYLVAQNNPEQHLVIEKLGLEPLTAPQKALLDIHPIRSAKKIKTFLLEQNHLAGIGNIYANEVLFSTKINPLKKMRDVTPMEWEKLIHQLKITLQDAIDHLGTTISDYKNPDDSKGLYQEKLLVYGRNEKPCLACGEKLKAIRLQGRTTIFCPSCQR